MEGFPTRRLPTLVAVVMLAAALVGCTRSTDGRAIPDASGSATTAPAADDCTSVSAPMTTIDSRGTDEPRLRIPTPPGWERTTKLDSELIRCNTWSATVTVQAMNADDPTYQSDASTILSGFQMLPPS